jgi:diguanylate cyclase (GGDEF)-like protein/PAS domain S-box-containing protein
MDSSAPAARTLALQPYNILDTLPEREYDDFTLLAAQICDTPMAVLNFLPADRVWTKAETGLPGAAPGSTPLNESFCIYSVENPAVVLEVGDARYDSRFAAHPSVTGDPFIRFYAGAPLVAPDGTAIGTLCVLDRVPRALNPGQAQALQALARQVVVQLELRRSVVALQESERRFQVFMEHSPAVAFLKDGAGRYVYVNQQFEQCFERKREVVIGKLDDEVWLPDMARAIQAIDDRVRADNTTHTLKKTVATIDGAQHTWQISMFPIGIGAERWLGGVATDITAQQQYALTLEQAHRRLQDTVQNLAQTSLTDALTRLPNRHALESALDNATLASRDSQQTLAIIVIDVDNFKHYNDTYGHPAGDMVLRQVADILKSGARGTDLVARYGGEEFVMMLSNTASEQAAYVAERCREAVAKAAWAGSPITISAGVAVRQGPGLDARGVLAAADAALYQAKHHGRNRVVSDIGGSLAAPQSAGACGQANPPDSTARKAALRTPRTQIQNP